MALYRIVRALRWNAVRGRGPTDLGRYRRSPRGPKWWRPYTSWGRFTSRGGVHAHSTKRQLANCFRWLYLRTSFLTPRRPCRRPLTRGGADPGRETVERTAGPPRRLRDRCRRGGGLRVRRGASAARSMAVRRVTRRSSGGGVYHGESVPTRRPILTSRQDAACGPFAPVGLYGHLIRHRRAPASGAS
jgi:hypothetical protein